MTPRLRLPGPRRWARLSIACLAWSVLSCAQQTPESAANARLAQLRRELTGGVTLAGPRTPSAGSKLAQILARPEFSSAVAEPSPLARWYRDFALWLQRKLAGLFRSAAQHPTTTQALFWLLALAALAFVAFMLLRFWRPNSPLPAEPLDSRRSAEATPFEGWMAAAQAAAQRNDFARAVQCCYWAAIAHLQNTGSLPREETHTPRELLRLLRAPGRAQTLRTLTCALERFWYGRVPASRNDFTACVEALAALGCKPE